MLVSLGTLFVGAKKKKNWNSIPGGEKMSKLGEH